MFLIGPQQVFRTVVAVRSTSQARKRFTQAQAKVRSTTRRFGWTTKPASVRLMISTGRGSAWATRGPWWTASAKKRLKERKAVGDTVGDERGAAAILHPGGMHLDAQHEAERVGDAVALAALDLLAGVEPTTSRASAPVLTSWLSMIAPLQLPAPLAEAVQRVIAAPGEEEHGEGAVTVA